MQIESRAVVLNQCLLPPPQVGIWHVKELLIAPVGTGQGCAIGS